MRYSLLKAGAVGWAVAALTTSAVLAQPAGIKHQDVGFPTLPGSYTVAAGKMTIVGGGNDIWGNSDNFHFAYIPVTGDFDYVVKVEDLQGPDNWSKAELMAREAADDGAGGFMLDGADRFIANMTTRAGGQNEVALQWRSDAMGSGCAWPNDIGIATPLQRPTYPNTWLRLERMGSKFWGYASTNGTNWTVLRGSPYDFEALNGTEAAPRTAGNMANKLALGLAVTAHNDGDTTGGIGVFSEFKAFTRIPIAIATQPPATVTTPANSTLTISVAATGDPVHYQWRKDGTDIPGAINPTFTKTLAQPSDAGSYTVRLFGAGQTQVISSASVVSVTVDNTPPTVVSARPLSSLTSLKVTFSEPVTAPTATTASNYQISGGVTVSTATLSADGFSVTLLTSAQAVNTEYTLTVSNVRDNATNPVAAGTTAKFLSVSLLKGFALYERWDDSSGDMGDINAFAAAIADGSARPPDVSSVVSQFGGPWGAADNYNGRARTFFTAPSSGDYVFFVSADDAARVYLSTDDKPANKKLICQESGWSNQYQWTAPGSGAAEDKRSDLFASTEWATFNQITLVGGKTYFMEVLWNEGGGGDGADVTFIKAGAADPANNADGMFMKGDVIAWYETADVLPPVIVTQPVDAITIDAGGTATISVVASNMTSAPLTYQWQRNGRNIAGATNASYVIANASPLDNGAYQVKVSNPKSTLTRPDDPTLVMVKGTGLFSIEAEDFDYDTAKTMPAASTMPYLGGAYANLGATFDVDYHNTDGLDATAYRTLPTGQHANNSAEMGAQWTVTRGGEWDVTANYKIGWVGAGDWGNYTRTFPTPAKTYYVVAAQSYDGTGAGQLNGSLGVVTNGVGTTNQTVVTLGVFDSAGSGAWSRNNLVALTDVAGGTAKTVELGGKQTIRWNYNSGDADYLLFYPVAAGTGKAKIALSAGNVTISEDPAGGAIVQSATAVTGPWTDVGPAPQTQALGTGTKFFRLKK